MPDINWDYMLEPPDIDDDEPVYRDCDCGGYQHCSVCHGLGYYIVDAAAEAQAWDDFHDERI